MTTELSKAQLEKIKDACNRLQDWPRDDFEGFARQHSLPLYDVVYLWQDPDNAVKHWMHGITQWGVGHPDSWKVKDQ